METTNTGLPPQPSLLRASTGKRLANYVIDILCFYAVFFVGAMVYFIVVPTAVETLEESSTTDLQDRVLALLLYAIFMGCVEALFKGKSLGKLITKTRAVNLDGTPISAQTAFARAFSRAVPFCAFSAFGNPCNPWQDKWTNTMVVEE